MRGKGVSPVRTSMKGDLICRIVVETPVNLDKEQKELLRKFQSTLDGDNKHSQSELLRKFQSTLDGDNKHSQSPQKKSFFDKLADWFD